MDNGNSDHSESAALLDREEKGGSRSGGNFSRDSKDSDVRIASDDTIAFETNLVKCSTGEGELAATWGGGRARSERGGRRRARSWSQSPHDDVNSEIRILRERLVRTQTRPRPGAVRLLSRRQRLTLVSLALVDFMSFCSMSVMAPFFPREAQLKGMSDTTCGLVFSFYAVVMFLTSPLFGKFMPVVGPKFMFTAGMFVAGTCNVIFGTLSLVQDPVTFTVLCFVVRGLEAVGASAYSTASYVFVVNAFPEAIGSVLGILETFVGLGMSVGPAIGGLLYSIGGFGLPFYTLGIIMVVTVPINHFLIIDCEDFITTSKTASILRLFKIPTIIITGLVIVVVSNTWAFLDPTLEPHLRQFGLSTQQIGLIFLLFSSLYGIFSPIWGWVADRIHNHWCMMVWGLFLSTLGLLLLGPCPFLPFLTSDLWLDLVALSILGMSVALTLLPTFQGVLTSSIYEGGCPEALATYSAVAGLWSCCYSLGEVLGPALGGALAQRYGFPLCATLCAAACFTMAVVTLTFFAMQESLKTDTSESLSDSIPYTDSTWNSSHFCRSRSAPAHCQTRETSPLLTSCSCQKKYGTQSSSLSRPICFVHNKNKSMKPESISIADVLTYFLKFSFITNTFTRIRKLYNKKSDNSSSDMESYQNYLSMEVEASKSEKGTENQPAGTSMNNNNNNEVRGYSQNNTDCNKYCEFLENAIFGSPDEERNLENLVVKKDSKGLVTKLSAGDDKPPSEEILKHNLEKVLFYEQSPPCEYQDGCRDDVTYVRGTVALSSTGACEV